MRRTGRDTALVDCGGANIASLRFALQRLGVDARFTQDRQEIENAERVILPGVGAAGAGMQRLAAAGLEDLIPRLTQPVLGICLGMQLLYEVSSENDTPCLGVIPGRVELLEGAPDLTIPHMGWNQVARRGEPGLMDGIPDGAWFYFVHSYAAPVTPDCVAETTHGRAFASVVRRDNFLGVQFHPERSGRYGQRLLRNFLLGARAPRPRPARDAPAAPPRRSLAAATQGADDAWS